MPSVRTAFLLAYQILNPGSFFDHPIAQGAFDEVGTLADKIQRDNGDGGVAAEEEGDGNNDTPDKTAIEDEGDGCFAAGTKGKVSRCGVGIEGHDACRDENQHRCNMADGIGSVVQPGEGTGNGSHSQTESQTAGNGNENQLVVGVADVCL